MKEMFDSDLRKAVTVLYAGVILLFSVAAFFLEGWYFLAGAALVLISAFALHYSLVKAHREALVALTEVLED